MINKKNIYHLFIDKIAIKKFLIKYTVNFMKKKYGLVYYSVVAG